MESSTSYVTVKDGFEVTLNKSGTELIIEAEDQGNGSAFSSRFSNDAIKGMGLEFFENVPELFEGLIIAFEGVSEDTSAKLSPDGKLTLIQKVKIGKNEKVFNSPIPLKLVEMDPINRLEKKMRKLFSEVEGLKKENQELREKLNMDYEVIIPTFNLSHSYYSYSEHFDVSQDKKQITRKGNDQKEHYMSIGSEIMLSQQNSSKFHVKMLKINSISCAIGVAIENERHHSFSNQSGVYCITLAEMSIGNPQKKSPNYFGQRKEPVISVLFVPHKGQILFEVDGVHLKTMKIDESHEKLNFYPFIGLSGNNEKVSFI